MSLRSFYQKACTHILAVGILQMPFGAPCDSLSGMDAAREARVAPYVIFGKLNAENDRIEDVGLTLRGQH